MSFSPSVIKIRLGKLVRFLGRRVIVCSGLRLGLSLALFGAELAFGYGVVHFFERLQTGITSPSLNWEWLRALSFPQFLGVFALVILARGAIEWSDSFLGREMAESFRNRQRLRLSEWLFYGRVGDVGTFQFLYTTQIEWSLACIQGALTLMKSATLAI